MVTPPAPIGLQLSQAARTVGRAFDHALTDAGGSLPVWLVLLNLRIRPEANQRELAETIGVREATLTHHLNAMEANGLLTRRRDPTNRRVHMLEVTGDGNAAFLRLAEAATGFDRQLRAGLSEAEIAQLGSLLARLVHNATGTDPTSRARSGVP